MNTNSLWLAFGIILVCDLLVATVRASLIQARLPYLVELRADHPRQVERTIHLMERSSLRASLRLWISFGHFSLALVSVLLLLRYAPTAQFGLALAAVGLVGLFALLGEFALEGWMLHRVEHWAMALTPLGKLMDWLVRPIAWLLMRFVDSPRAMQRTANMVTDDELRTWLEESQPEGGLEKSERRMIYSIFQFGDTLCREIMIPRMDVFALDVNTSIPEAISMALQSGHSRMPVYEDSIDHVIGILYAKDLLRANLTPESDATIRMLLRQAYFVPEAKNVDDLLREMQLERVHMAVVVDEYGGTAGLITLEDIVEEIVGEIRDEYDQLEEVSSEQLSEGEYLLHARMDLNDINDLLGTHLSKEIADTLAGYISNELGHVPLVGEKIEVENWVFSVEQIIGRRIHQVRAQHMLPQSEKVEDKDESNG